LFRTSAIHYRYGGHPHYQHHLIAEYATAEGDQESGAFPNDEAMFKLLHPALTNISKKRTMQLKDWKSALNQFSIIFEERLPGY
jgi:transposase-like protein